MNAQNETHLTVEYTNERGHFYLTGNREAAIEIGNRFDRSGRVHWNDHNNNVACWPYPARALQMLRAIEQHNASVDAATQNDPFEPRQTPPIATPAPARELVEARRTRVGDTIRGHGVTGLGRCWTFSENDHDRFGCRYPHLIGELVCYAYFN